MNECRFSRVVVAVVMAATIAGCSRNDPDKFIASAETYLAKSNYPAAIIELKNALSSAPDNARARFLLGKALLDSGDPVAAATEFRKALTLRASPDDVYPLLAAALVQQGAPKTELVELTNVPLQSVHAKAEIAAMIGLAYLGYGQPKEARAQIESALALEPSNLHARLAQARLMAVENDLPGALRQVDAVLATAPDDFDTLMLKSEVEIAMGSRTDGVLTLERIVTLRPAAFHARYILVSNYLQSKELDKATVQVDELKKQAPGDPRTLHAIAMVAFTRGDDTTALDAVQKSMQAAPDFLPARYLSGLVDLRRGAYASAEQSLRAVVAKSPDDNGARIALAQTLLHVGQATRAQEVLEPVLRRQPADIGTLRLAAEIQLALKKPDRAAEYIVRANALDKNNIGGLVRLAEVRLAKGDIAQGLRDLEALAASAPDERGPDAALISAHLRARDYDKALAAADALIKKQPKDPAAHIAKGTVYAAKGDLKNARQSYEKALALDPDFALAIYSLAGMDLVERNFAEARKHLEKIVAKDPKSERALLGLAQLQIAANAAPAEIAAAIQRAITANPASAAARVALINFYARQKDWKAAIAAGQAAEVAIPETPLILEALAAVQQAGGENNQAIETYTRLAKFQPYNPLILMRIASIHASLQNYDAAIASLKSALAVAPANSTVWVALAAAYTQAGQAEAGLAEARKLQRDVSTRAAGYVLEAELFTAQKKLPEAVAAYRAALAKEPLSFSVIRLRALLLAMGKPDDAASLTQKWLKEHPKDVQVRTYLGQQSLANGDFRAAAEQFNPAVEMEPENAVLLNNLAWSLSELKDAKALGYAERAYRLAPDSAAVANTYGWVLVERGDMAQGIPLLRKSVDLDPSDAGRRLYLARALIKSGDKAAARTELAIVAKTDSMPARTQAEQLMKDL